MTDPQQPTTGAPPEKTRILVVDDHPVFRQGMVQVIAATGDLDPVAQAGSGEEALEEIGRAPVDAAVVDIDMPGMNGLQLARVLHRRTPRVPLVVLTMHKSERLFNEAIDIGITAYLLKDEAVRTIVDGIRAAVANRPFVSPSLSEFVVRRASRTAELQKRNTGLDSLTPAERTVLRFVSENLSSKEIAAELSISPRTVGAHRNNISRKLGLTGKHPLLNFALANRSAILSLPE